LSPGGSGTCPSPPCSLIESVVFSLGGPISASCIGWIAPFHYFRRFFAPWHRPSSRSGAKISEGAIETPDSRRDRPVRLTRIYTRTGDGGETSLGDGTRVPKTDALIAAIGAVDELNAALGMAIAAGLPGLLQGPLERIQNELFDLGADLSAPPAEGARERLRIGRDRIEALERLCDELNEALEPLRSFVLPGGGEGGARLHLARSVCRRAERDVLAAAAERPQNPLAAVYLNRLSDLLFVCARVAGVDDERLWRPGASE
jgi:cob(I)alamin adenosyltransferase